MSVIGVDIGGNSYGYNLKAIASVNLNLYIKTFYSI